MPPEADRATPRSVTYDSIRKVEQRREKPDIDDLEDEVDDQQASHADLVRQEEPEVCPVAGGEGGLPADPRVEVVIVGPPRPAEAGDVVEVMGVRVGVGVVVGAGGGHGTSSTTLVKRDRATEEEETYQKLRARAREQERRMQSGENGGEDDGGGNGTDGNGAAISPSSGMGDAIGGIRGSSGQALDNNSISKNSVGIPISQHQIDLPTAIGTAFGTLHSLLETSFQDQNYYTARAQAGQLIEGEFQSMKASRLMAVWISYVDGLETLASALGELDYSNQEKLFAACPPWWLLTDVVKFVYIPEIREMVLGQKKEVKSKMASEALLAAESTVVKLMQHVVSYLKKDGLFVFSSMNFIASAAGDALCAEFLRNELAPLADIFR